MTQADVEASTSVVVDLDCLGELLADCANGSESACEEVDKTEPLPCLAQNGAGALKGTPGQMPEAPKPMGAH